MVVVGGAVVTVKAACSFVGGRVKARPPNVLMRGTSAWEMEGELIVVVRGVLEGSQPAFGFGGPTRLQAHKQGRAQHLPHCVKEQNIKQRRPTPKTTAST